MNGLVKIGAVLAGYAVAFLVASVAVYFRLLATMGDDARASAGMYAFGDAILFAAVFGFTALFPTGLILYFLRPFPKFWTALSITSLPLAVTGPAAALLNGWASGRPLHQPILVVLAFFGVLRVFAAPLLFAGFIICAFLAPTQRPRRLLLAAAAIESTVGAYVFYWFVSHRLL